MFHGDLFPTVLTAYFNPRLCQTRTTIPIPTALWIPRWPHNDSAVRENTSRNTTTRLAVLDAMLRDVAGHIVNILYTARNEYDNAFLMTLKLATSS